MTPRASYAVRAIALTPKGYAAASEPEPQPATEPQPGAAICGARRHRTGEGSSVCTRPPGHNGGHLHRSTGIYWPAEEA